MPAQVGSARAEPGGGGMERLASLGGEAQRQRGRRFVAGELVGLASPQVDDLAVAGVASVGAQRGGEVVHLGVRVGRRRTVVVVEAVADPRARRPLNALVSTVGVAVVSASRWMSDVPASGQRR